MQLANIMKNIGLVGTYDSDEHQGLYRFCFDEAKEAFTACQPFYTCSGAKCAAYVGDGIVTVFEDKAQHRAGILLLDKAGQLLDSFADENVGACFIAADGNLVYTANYHDGAAFVYRINGRKIELVKKIAVQPKAGCHQVIRRGDLLLVPCLLLDRINLYDCKNDYEPCGAITFAPGTGPRHGIFKRGGEEFYLVSELSNQLFHYHWPQQGAPNLVETLDFLPQEERKNSASAAIRLSQDERHLYLSTRGSDLLSVFALGDETQLIQQCSCGGSHPRDFVLSQTGSYLLVTNRSTDELVALPIAADGRVGVSCAKVHVPSCIGITLEESGENQ